MPVPVQSDGFNSALSPVVYGDIALSINTHYITFLIIIPILLGLKIILPFPLNHPSLLLIYRYCFVCVSQLNLVWRFNGMITCT